MSICDVSCKDYHRWIRNLIVDPLSRRGHQDQCGGLRHRGADTAAHYSRAHFEWVDASSANGSQLCVDQKAAFASDCRGMASREHITDEEVAALFSRLGIKTTVQEFARALETPAFRQIDMAPRHVVVVNASNKGSWFTTQGLQQPASTTTGSKAGNPLGDAVFNLIQSKALLECDARLAAEGLENVVAIAPQDVGRQEIRMTRAEQVSYFDDVIFLSMETVLKKSIRDPLR